MEVDELSSTFCGSTVYAAPEILASSDDYNAFYSDIWSCGIILYAMFTAKLPFDREKLTRFAEYKIVEGNFEYKGGFEFYRSQFREFFILNFQVSIHQFRRKIPKIMIELIFL